MRALLVALLGSVLLITELHAASYFLRLVTLTKDGTFSPDGGSNRFFHGLKRSESDFGHPVLNLLYIICTIIGVCLLKGKLLNISLPAGFLTASKQLSKGNVSVSVSQWNRV